MRCLYCGKELALFKRLRGGEFCSDAHRLRYQEEYTQLALNRLLQANSSKEAKDSKESTEKDAKAPLGKNSGSTNGRESKPEANKPAAPIESPAIKRRERLKEEGPGPLSTPARVPAASSPEPMAPAARAGTQALAEESQEIAEPAASFDHAREQVSSPVEEELSYEPDSSSPPMGDLLIEVPVPVFANVAEMSKPEADISAAGETWLPRAQEVPPGIERTLNLVGRVESIMPGEVDWLAPRQRALEVRDFVRSVPIVEILMKPAGETDLPWFDEPFEIGFELYPVDAVADLSQESVREFPPPALEFRELARLNFEPTGWGENAGTETETEAEVEEKAGAPEQTLGLAPEQPLPASQNLPVAPELSRREPVQVDPVHFESPRPRAFHFEPVKIETVFSEPAIVESNLAEHDRADDISSPAPLPEAATLAADVPAEPLPQEPPAFQAPEAVTRPEPVTLHGIAPPRGKAVQAFASALPRDVEIQSPRQSSLPLRPAMVLSPSPASAVETKAPAAPSVPEKQDPRTPIGKRKPEVRVLTLPVRTESKPAGSKTSPAQPTPAKPEARPVEAAKLDTAKPADSKLAAKPKEPQKETPQKQAAPKDAVQKDAVQKDAVQKAPAKKEDLRKPSPAADAPQRSAPVGPAAPIPDLLGLPTLSLENSGGLLSRIPMMLRIGIAAAVLAAVGAAIFLTSHGSGATATKAKVTAPTVVEAGPALATTAGWIQDWFTDPRGSKLARHVDVLRGSLALRDYRLEMEGQIDQGAIGWVFRANNKDFYAEKVAIVKPGLEPGIALVRIAVIDGQEVVREQVPLNLKVHLDTLYKIRVDAVGHRFTTWVQDQQVDEWNDSRIEAGGVGLYYDSGESAHLKGTLNVVPLKEK